MLSQFTPETTRREGVEAIAVQLSDGAKWSFMRPTVRLRPRIEYEVDGSGRKRRRIRVEIYRGYPAEIDALIERLHQACAKEIASEQYDAFFSMATALLLRAHSISVEYACRLLEVSASETSRLVRDIMGVVAYREELLESSNGKSANNESTT